MRGQGQADPDAPDCPESVLFWVSSKARLEDKSKVSATSSLKMNGPASNGFVEDLTQGVVGMRPALPPQVSGVPGMESLLETHRSLQGRSGWWRFILFVV